MGDEGRPSDDKSRATDPADRLDSWKEISSYLGRGVRTIQRWERFEGLPVHRQQHAAKGSVFAFRSELEAWRAKRSDVANERVEPSGSDGGAEPAGPLPRPRFRRALLALAIAIAIGALALASLRAGRNGTSLAHRDAPTVRPLAVDSENEGHPSLSPDGQEVVYHRWLPTAGLVIQPTAGGPPRTLTQAPPEHLDLFPVWSPRGDAIAFLRQKGWQPARRELIVVSLRDGTQRRIANPAGVGLAWAPDGRSLAYVDSESAGEPHAIFLVSLETARRRRLTSPPPGTFGDLYFAFSPDGRTLAFSRWPTTATGDIWTMPADGGEARQLTNGAMVQDGLDWTPDGTSIVFSSRRGGGLLGLWALRIAAGAKEAPLLVPGTGGAVFPSFSRPRHGERGSLAYEACVRDVNIWRWRASAGGAGTFDRVVASTSYDDHPAFSPDERRLLFTSNRSGHVEVWAANADGSDPTQLTQRQGPLAMEARYSPDGSSIAFTSAVGDNSDIFVARADGSGSRRLTSEPSDEGAPSWSRDGRWIYFRSNRGGVPQIWKAPSAGGTAVPVTRGEGWQAFEAPDGTRVYFVRSRDLHGIWAAPADGGPETLVVPNVREGFWAVADTGLFFLAQSEAWTIQRFDFASATTSRVATLPGNREVHPGFDVSPDGRSVLWTQVDTSSSDIMLLDPWID
jgi:Tol biopolymer transport system component